MGNILPKIVFEDIDDNRIDSQSNSNESLRTRHLMEIRQLNIRKQKNNAGIRLDQPSNNAIIEDAMLEDLCLEAGVEAEDIQSNGKISEKQKSLVLDRLSKSNLTKQHFQSRQIFHNYVDSKILGDESTQEQLARSTIFNNPINHNESHESFIESNNKIRNERGSTTSNTFQRQSKLGYRVPVSLQSRNSRHISKVSSKVRQSNLNNSRHSRMISQLENSRMSMKRNTNQSGADWRKSRNISNTYSLPSNFYTPYNTVEIDNRRTQSTVCKNNEHTLQMAEKIAFDSKVTKKHMRICGCLTLTIH